MHEFESTFGKWVIKLRWVIIVTSIILIMLAANGCRFLSFTTNYRVFFSKDNPQLMAFNELEKTYTKNDNVMFVITPSNGNVFTKNTLAAVEELTKEAWQTPFSIRVDSLTNFQHTEAKQDDLIVSDLVYKAAHLTDTKIEKIRGIALNEPLLVNHLVSKKGNVTAVNVTIQLPGKDETKEVPKVVSYARSLADKFENKYPQINIRLTGMVMMNNAFSEASLLDMKQLLPISIGIMILSLGLLLRSLVSTFGTVLIICFSIVAAMGLGGYFGLPITPPSASAPIIILTVAIANSVHVLVTFIHEMQHGSSKEKALIESLRVNLQPVFLASITTAIGFLTMNFSEVPPFKHLGNFVSMGVMISFILAVTFLPALMSILPVRVKIIENSDDNVMAKFGNFVVRNRTGLLWGMVILIVTLISFLPRNVLNDVFVRYFDKNIAFRVDADYTTQNLTGLYYIDYSLDSGEPGGISNPEFLLEVEAFSNWYRKQPETMHVNSITDTMKRLNMNTHGDDPKWYRLPQERDLAAQYLLLYEMSLPYGLDLNNQINVDKSSTRLTAGLKTISTNEVLDLEESAQKWLKENAPHIKLAKGSGPTIMFTHIGKRNIISMLIGTTVALILISLILIFALRSLKIGLISLVPNLVPAAMGFGLWGLLVGEVGLALSVVTSMTLGIVVDDTVHFLSKYLRAHRERGFGAQAAVRYAFTNVGRAMLITSIVLVAGFLILAMSSFKLNSGMGLLSAIVITIALLADFLLLPPLLIKLEEKNDEKVTAVRPAVDTSAI